MNAVISGRAGLALLIEGESLMSLNVDDPETLVPRSRQDLRFLLAEADDLIALDNVDRTQIARRLEFEHNVACALDMALIALDPGASMELRAEAVSALEELLLDPHVVERLEVTLYAKPLPDSSDLTGAQFCTEATTPLAQSLFERLGRNQPAIRLVRETWDAMPFRVFGDEEKAKAVFHDAAYREGLFRALALSCGDQAEISEFRFNALNNKSISGLHNYRDVLQRWTAPIREKAATKIRTPSVAREAAEEREERPRDKKSRKPRRREPGEVLLQKVMGQKKVIVEAMKERDLSRAREVLEELVDFHRDTGRPEHLAMTLCDLAMEAKTLGIRALQLELTERSVEAKPDDAWSWAQHGDALLNNGRMDEAMFAYEQADAFGAGPVAKNGRAEVLKAQGRLSEAEAAFDAVIAAHPENVFAKSGRAEVLKAEGKLSAALAAYESIVVAHPEDQVARNARSCILAALGRYSEALTHLPSDNPATEPNWIGYRIRGMTLLRMGDIDAASQVFELGKEFCPWALVRERFDASVALTRLRRRQFRAAREVLDRVNSSGFKAQVQVLTLHALGELEEHERAIDVYTDLNANPRPFPDDLPDELFRRYIAREGSLHDDDWVGQKEVDMFLLGSIQP
ncbi:MAG TPA: tetratricopeptide repeat protein [Blastocatellia bacterium]|nr:tetratricopeptide repeat protein [Blastocatellia bacterium]